MPVLDSIRVVELTEALAGPYCAMMLGDFGADVIKVERRQTGDQSRSWGPPFVGSESAYFLATNRNKRSLSLDYDQPLGAEILHRCWLRRMCSSSTSAIVASLERRGLDAETICARYPRLVYCAISGYGHSGPRSGLPGYDIIAQAQAGIMSFTGEPEGEPVRYPIAIADMACGLYSALGILAALLAREKTGTGQALDMALFDSQLTLLINAGSNYLNAGRISAALGKCASEHCSLSGVSRRRRPPFCRSHGHRCAVAAVSARHRCDGDVGGRCALSHQCLAYGTSSGADSCAMRDLRTSSGERVAAADLLRKISQLLLSRPSARL